MTASGLVPLVRRGSRPACLVLPGAGGGLRQYFPLAAVLGRTYQVYGLPADGLEAGDEPLDSVAAMADRAVAALAAAGVRPVLVLGWSLGGVVAWETCVRLGGARPALALLDSSPAPGHLGPAERDRLHQRVLGALGPRPAAGTADRVRRTLDAQLTAAAAYRCRTPYEGEVVLVSCRDADPAGLPGWRALAPRLHEARIDTDHFDVLDPEHLPALLDALAPVLPAAVPDRLESAT